MSTVLSGDVTWTGNLTNDHEVESLVRDFRDCVRLNWHGFMHQKAAQLGPAPAVSSALYATCSLYFYDVRRTPASRPLTAHVAAGAH